MRQIRIEAPELNKQLTELESKFSAQLGEASRQTQVILLAANGLLAVMLTLFGVTFVRRTARIQAKTEAEVVRRQESLQNLLDSAAEGLFGVDTSGRCTFVNRAALQILGYDSEQELLGSRSSILSTSIPWTHVRIRDSAREPIRTPRCTFAGTAASFRWSTGRIRWSATAVCMVS